MLAQTIVIAFVVSLAAIAVLLARFGGAALDAPNARSLHERPVPRTGGIGVLAGAVTGFILVENPLWLPMGVALALAVLSFVDDVRGMPTAARLAAHLAAAGLLCWYVLSPMSPIVLAALILAVAWITNLYNFMDGSDGLAGGMALIGFGTYAVAASLADDLPLAALAAALAAAAAAFLVYNFHPARIFLGDAGSIPLGYLAATLGIIGWRNDAWPLWFPLLAFGPFIGDATITLLKRLARRERVWRAHRDHYYQRMVRMGLGHRATALIGYAMMAICGAVAILARDEPPALQAAAFGGASLLLAAMALWVDLRWARFVRGQAA